jgi:hypothetical protein
MTAAKIADPAILRTSEVWFASDSPLEGDGFEPSVPRKFFLAAPSIDPTRLNSGGTAAFVVCGQVRSGLVWGFSCQAVVLGCADSFLFGAGKAVFRPVACNQVPGARGRGQGTETLAELGGLPPSVACVSQRLDA